jgi:CBS domain-containing protein
MSVGKICTRSVSVASPDESIAVAARRMAEHGVGTLVREVDDVLDLLAEEAQTIGRLLRR